MFYAWEITIPAGTTEAAPVEEILHLSKGVITSLNLYFPPGCHGLVKCRLFAYDHQLIPLNPGGWVIADGETVPTETYYELFEAPPQLKFKGCSPLASYDHVVTVRAQVTQKPIAQKIADWLGIR